MNNIQRLVLLCFAFFIMHVPQSAATYCHATVHLPQSIKNIIQASILDHFDMDLDVREKNCKVNCNRNRKCLSSCAERFYSYGKLYKNFKVKEKLIDVNEGQNPEFLLIKDGQFPFHITLCYDRQSKFYQCAETSDREELKQSYAEELQSTPLIIRGIDVFGKYVVALLSPEKIISDGEEMSDNLHVSLISSSDPAILQDLKERLNEKLGLINEPIILSVQKEKVTCK